jgi:hypothetical protein
MDRRCICTDSECGGGEERVQPRKRKAVLEVAADSLGRCAGLEHAMGISWRPAWIQSCRSGGRKGGTCQMIEMRPPQDF